MLVVDPFSDFTWQGLCPLKFEIFVWQLLKGRTLVKEVLAKFGVGHITTSGCPMCEGDIESIDHVFLVCNWANKVWRECMGWWNIFSCSSSSIKDWVMVWNALCPSKSVNRTWNILFFAIVWTIWESRNEVVFHGLVASHQKALNTIKFCVALWFKNFGCGSDVDLTLLMLDVKERCVDSNSTKVIRSKTKVISHASKFCFYVDGSSRGNPGEAGIGGVLRDDNGKILGMFSYYVGVLGAMSVEIYVIHRACQLLIDKMASLDSNIIIFSDSSSVVDWCNGEEFGNFNLVLLVHDIR
ncbi:hypothetical protein Ddye_022467 [Dipteronia dyeriana]|uniref:RNase H type-1 domain-containing protein n=1 Tax=Dipteronia dyeriana TaxID=168575 RepID=A0AAD9U3Q6_9ROSI|nr:hypothetical protein Ddye_022467 [Dipteronia dyeriana]